MGAEKHPCLLFLVNHGFADKWNNSKQQETCNIWNVHSGEDSSHSVWVV